MGRLRAFYVTAPEVCAALVDSLEGGRPDGKETKKTLALPLGDFFLLVYGKRIRCGLTLAAAMLFLAWQKRIFSGSDL